MLLARHVVFTAALFASFVLAAPAADTDEKAPFKLTKEEQAILDLTNAERVKEKLPPLKASEKLTEAARLHSANMAKQRKLEHELDGVKPQGRVKAAGYTYRTTGENIGKTPRYSPSLAVQMWMKSPPHRANMLSDRYEELGVGVARDAKGGYFYTRVFGSPRSKK